MLVLLSRMVAFVSSSYRYAAPVTGPLVLLRMLLPAWHSPGGCQLPSATTHASSPACEWLGLAPSLAHLQLAWFISDTPLRVKVGQHAAPSGTDGSSIPIQLCDQLGSLRQP